PSVGFLRKSLYYPSVIALRLCRVGKGERETERGRTTWVVCHSLGWQQQPSYFSELPSRRSNNSQPPHRRHRPVMARQLPSNRQRLRLLPLLPKARTTVGTMFSLSLTAAVILSHLKNLTSLAIPQ